MRKLLLILGLVLLVWGIMVAWQIGSCELANYELRDDITNIASQGATRIGMSRPETDDEMRLHVIRAAAEHGVHLEPNEVTVQTTAGTDTFSTVISVDYPASVRVPGLSFDLHFASTAHGKPWGPRDLR